MKNGFITGIVVFLVAPLIAVTIYHFIVIKNLNTELSESRQKVDSLQFQVDSLDAELFPIQVELGRYEMAYEIFLQRNQKAAQQYGTIISEETE